MLRGAAVAIMCCTAQLSMTEAPTLFASVDGTLSAPRRAHAALLPPPCSQYVTMVLCVIFILLELRYPRNVLLG